MLFGVGDPQPDFVVMSCTSIATPHATGAILLLADAGITFHLAQKAILINTATTWSDANTPNDPNDDSLTPNRSGWNKCYGWVSLNMNNEYFNMNNCLCQNMRIYPCSSGSEKPFQFIRLTTMDDWTHITLSWDIRYFATRLNDLDPDIYLEATNARIGRSASVIDNVEQLTPCGPGRENATRT